MKTIVDKKEETNIQGNSALAIGILFAFVFTGLIWWAGNILIPAHFYQNRDRSGIFGNYPIPLSGLMQPPGDFIYYTSCRYGD